ncbi:MAG: hypothetical protein QOD68_20 [Actinomycetota bacterium]|nr:hypothetical protein [Actinomycetota bacterium]
MRSVGRGVAALLAPALLGGAGSAVAVALVLGPTAPVPAVAATRPCVGMIVDGRLAGGSLRTGCAKGDPGSGLEALTDAGFSYAFVPRQPGQVCQIDGLPECSRNGSDTYWSYWHRAKGSHGWVYSGEGAATYDPEPGDTEAWVWQEGGKRLPPDIAFGTLCPQTAAADVEPSDPPLPAATAKKTTTAGPTGSGEVEPLPDLTTTPPALKPSPATSSSSTTPTPTSPPPTTTPTTTAQPSPRASPVSSTDDGGGPPWAGLAVGVAVVALLGGAAVARARRTGGSP